MSNGRPSGPPDPDAPRTKREIDLPPPPESPQKAPALELPTVHDAIRQMRDEASAQPGQWRQTDTRDQNVHVGWLHQEETSANVEGASDVLAVYGHFVRPNTTTYTTVLRLLPQDLEIVDVEPRPQERYLLIELNPTRGTAALGDLMNPPICGVCGRAGSPRFPIVGRRNICPLCATGAE